MCNPFASQCRGTNCGTTTVMTSPGCRAAAICSVAAKLDSTNSADYPPLFQGRPQPGAKFPPRYGYFVGFLVAQDLGRNRSLKQLAALTPQQAEPLIKDSLRAMADCPKPSANIAAERG